MISLVDFDKRYDLQLLVLEISVFMIFSNSLLFLDYITNFDLDI